MHYWKDSLLYCILLHFVSYSTSSEEDWELITSDSTKLGKRNLEYNAPSVYGSLASPPFERYSEIETQIRNPVQFGPSYSGSSGSAASSIGLVVRDHTGSGLTGISCSRPGYLKNPSDCHKFYNCIKFGGTYQLFSLNCVEGTVFYPPLSKCVNPTSISPRLRPTCSLDGRSRQNPLRPTSKPVDLMLLGDKDVEIFNENGVPMTSDTNIYEGIEETVPETSSMLPNDFLAHVGPKDSETFIQFLRPQNSLTAANDIESLEDYSEDAHMQFLDTLEDQAAAEIGEMQVETPMRRGFNKRNLKPKVWFGIKSRDINGVRTIGNPFKDDETTIAVILDFSTSRLQIYSRNKPPK